MPFFERLVNRFYDQVAVDPVLLRWYDVDDLTGARRRLTLFLAQYWGGPTTYDDERGHPRLRMRHMGFRIGPQERDHWLAHMGAAIDELDPPEPIRTMLVEYFTPAAEHLRNDTGLPISSAKPRRTQPEEPSQ